MPPTLCPAHILSLYMNFWTGYRDKCMQWVLKWWITSRGCMSLSNRCNANSYCMLVMATHVMPCPNFSITYELLTNLQGQKCALLNYPTVNTFRSQHPTVTILKVRKPAFDTVATLKWRKQTYQKISTFKTQHPNVSTLKMRRPAYPNVTTIKRERANPSYCDHFLPLASNYDLF